MLQEILARKQAEQHSFLLQQKMLNFAEQIKIKLRSFWSIITELKDEIMRISREEEDLADSLMSTLVSLLFRNNCTSQINENLVVPTKLSGGSVYELADANYRAAVHELNTEKEIATCTESLQGCELEIRDAREALAIAVQGKVAALLLLSQQEERQIFEKNMISDRESKIAQLQKQLLQVSIDKGHALLKVANLTEELEKVQREHRGMQLRHSSCIQNRLSSDQRAQSSRFPVKSWLNSSKKLGSKSIP
ncbi:hypothetical protein KP509_25G024700 [Ceratopteris richardii]|uniref:Uncharacterized protein n=2 Tax=Ceratopteris richardii TaxID=49495 RepID=A0A8T2RPM5_CERRI|nr:hypothetical protein KP509_25G024700 [Ceratopteris richardii]